MNAEAFIKWQARLALGCNHTALSPTFKIELIGKRSTFGQTFAFASSQMTKEPLKLTAFVCRGLDLIRNKGEGNRQRVSNAS
jgi:hypothetical protein